MRLILNCCGEIRFWIIVLEIKVTHEDGMRFRATDGEYEVTGGEGEGTSERDNMSPGDLFIASVGMCVGTFVKKFCERKDIPYHNMEIVLDYEEAESPKRVESLDVDVRLSEIPEKYESALQRVAASCYVKKSIEKGMEFDLSVSERE